MIFTLNKFDPYYLWNLFLNDFIFKLNKKYIHYISKYLLNSWYEDGIAIVMFVIYSLSLDEMFINLFNSYEPNFIFIGIHFLYSEIHINFNIKKRNSYKFYVVVKYILKRLY